MGKQGNRSRRYTAEFKRDAVALALASDKTVTEVARDLGISAEALRGWVKQAEVDRGDGPAGALKLLLRSVVEGASNDDGRCPAAGPTSSAASPALALCALAAADTLGAAAAAWSTVLTAGRVTRCRRPR